MLKSDGFSLESKCTLKRTIFNLRQFHRCSVLMQIISSNCVTTVTAVLIQTNCNEVSQRDQDKHKHYVTNDTRYRSRRTRAKISAGYEIGSGSQRSKQLIKRDTWCVTLLANHDLVLNTQLQIIISEVERCVLI